MSDEHGDKLHGEIRMIPLTLRLDRARDMIGKMCAESRPPAMTIPPRAVDEDVFIDLTLQDALVYVEGENIRDRFAMAALEGMISNPECTPDNDQLAAQAYEVADAMLKARNA